MRLVKLFVLRLTYSRRSRKYNERFIRHSKLQENNIRIKIFIRKMPLVTVAVVVASGILVLIIYFNSIVVFTSIYCIQKHHDVQEQKNNMINNQQYC